MVTARFVALLPVAWLLAVVVWVQVSPDGSHGATIAAMTAALLCGLAAQLAHHRMLPAAVVGVTEPPARRLHGSFHQQSRPGVPGRIRARAPGDER